MNTDKIGSAEIVNLKMSVINMKDDKCGTEQGIERADQGDVTEAQIKPCEGGVQVATPSEENVEAAKIRKKHRRGSKKHKPRKPRYKWRPYNKLTWEEKRKLNERDTIRAERRREEIRQKGRPIAPYNTTQFLMDEHDTIEPDLRDLSPDFYNQSPAFNISKTDIEEVESLTSDESFYEKDFSEMYEATHAETLYSMSKEQLIESYLQLENRIEFLEKEVRSKRGSCSLSSEGSVNSVEKKDNFCTSKIESSIKDEKLKKENEMMKEENEVLREELEALKQSLKT